MLAMLLCIPQSRQAEYIRYLYEDMTSHLDPVKPDIIRCTVAPRVTELLTLADKCRASLTVYTQRTHAVYIGYDRIDYQTKSPWRNQKL
jgi:hypothetical protein